MIEAAASVDRRCRFCKTADGKVIDHRVPVFITPCPAYEAADPKARVQMAKEGTELTFLCDPCHDNKTADDNELAAAMARCTLFLKLLPLDKNKPFTIEQLRSQYADGAIQLILRDAWFGDRRKDGTWRLYDYGEHGMPQYECQTCHKVGEA
jgi:hypothetical protein